MKNGIPWPVATCAGLAAGTVPGLVNAGLVIVARVPPIIATLSALYAVSGLALVVTDGNFVAPWPEAFNAVGQSTVGPIPLLIVYATAIGIAFHLLLTRTAFGFDVKVIGGNESAARANGVAVNRTKTWIFMISGGVAALAGILHTSRTGTADPQAGGADITLQVIAAVLIGGTSVFGGIGTIAGTALGAILFAEIQNALAVLGVNPLYQNIVIGIILAAAVTTDTWRRTHAFNRRTTRR
jgi:ribose transport system permease protein